MEAKIATKRFAPLGAVTAILVALMFTVVLAPQLASADTVTNNGHTWEWNFESTSGELVISGQVDLGRTGDPKKEDVPWHEHCSQVKSVSFGTPTSLHGDVSQLFHSCSSLKRIDGLEDVDTKNAINMRGMFNNCSTLTSLNVSSFDTVRVANMASMFYGCSSLTSLDVSKFDTSNVTDMRRMFSGCSSLTSLDVSKFDTSNVKYMGFMFFNCSSLLSLELSRFDTSKVANMRRMFLGCSSLASLDLSSFDTSSVTDIMAIFDGCDTLVAFTLGGNWKSTDTYTGLPDGWYEDRDGDGKIDFGDTQFTGDQVIARGSGSLQKLRYLKRDLNSCQVTWTIYGDPVHGVPAGGGSPAPTTALEFDRLDLSAAPATSWTTSNGRPSGTRGTLSFSGWSTGAPGGFVTSDTIVTGSWKFTPDPVKPAVAAIPTAAAVEKRVLAMKTDKDVAGSTFAILQARASKATKTSVTIKWTKVKGATKYVVYGNRCGKRNRYVKIKTVKGSKTSFKHKRLKGKTYHKYVVVAVGKSGGSEVALATSKTIHAATKGSSKRANPAKVKSNKMRLSLRKGKTAKLKAKQVKKKGTKVSTHRKVAYESSNPKVVTVSSKGRVTAKGKGTAYVFAYAQNGVFAKVKVTVG